MPILSQIANMTDLSIKQMVFFYELCKMGVVRFDLNKSQHKDILTQMVDKLKRNSQKECKPDGVVRQQLFALIMFQILKYAIPEERGE